MSITAAILPFLIPPPPPIFGPDTPNFKFSCNLYTESGDLTTVATGKIDPISSDGTAHKGFRYSVKYSSDDFDNYEAETTIIDLEEPQVNYVVAKSVSYTDFSDESRKDYTLKFPDWRAGYGYLIVRDIVKDRQRVDQLNSIGICHLDLIG